MQVGVVVVCSRSVVVACRVSLIFILVPYVSMLRRGLLLYEERDDSI